MSSFDFDSQTSIVPQKIVLSDLKQAIENARQSSLDLPETGRQASNPTHATLGLTMQTRKAREKAPKHVKDDQLGEEEEKTYSKPNKERHKSNKR